MARCDYHSPFYESDELRYTDDGRSKNERQEKIQQEKMGDYHASVRACQLLHHVIWIATKVVHNHAVQFGDVGSTVEFQRSCHSTTSDCNY